MGDLQHPHAQQFADILTRRFGGIAPLAVTAGHATPWVMVARDIWIRLMRRAGPGTESAYAWLCCRCWRPL